MRSELSLEKNPNLDNGIVGRLFKIFFRYALKILQDLITKRMMQLRQCYASYEVVLAVFLMWSCPDGKYQSLEHWDKV